MNPEPSATLPDQTLSQPSAPRTLILFWAAAIVATAALLILRRPDAVLHAQFWAEDGVVWFADAYNFGALQALLR